MNYESRLKELNLMPPGGFIAGLPRAALLIWFFGGFGCGVLLFMVVLVIYKHKNR